jgi:arylsulfatase
MEPNVLLVVLDSVRARNTSLHGHDNETTPVLESLAERATWYTQARAPAATSLTSHASIFTGLAVPEHGLTTPERVLRPGNTIFEQLRDDGYTTGVFSENTWITDVEAGLNRFDTVVGPQNVPFPSAMNPRRFVADEGRGQYGAFLREALQSDAPLRSLCNGLAIKGAYDFPALVPDWLKATTTGARYVDELTDWMDDTDGPWAACLNLMDAHIPYEPPADHDRWGGDRARSLQNHIKEQKWEFSGGKRPWWQKRALEGLYDGAIRQADALVGEVVDALEARGELDDTLLVVTADHGEGFGERSLVRPNVRVAEHNVSIHEALLHVPLLVKAPGQTEGERVDDLVSLAAFPTAVERARDARDPDFRTDDPVVSTAVGLDEAKQARARPHVEDLSLYTATTQAVYDRDGDDVVKYVTWRDRARTISVPDTFTSYVREDTDHGRVDDVFGAFGESTLVDAGSGVDEMDETTQRQLEDLGYI